MKHNKIRNTGLIFEILSRLLMRETMDNNTTAYRIVRKHFKPGSELVKELKLYQSLGQPTSHNPTELLELSIQAHSNLDKKKLFAEKYDLIRSVKKNYNPNVFFQTRVSNYKLSASIYKLFEFNSSADPSQYLECRELVTESLKGQSKVNQQEIETIVRSQDPDIRKLSFKIIVEKFNEKYKGLNQKQQNLLQKYISEDVNKTAFKDFFMREVGYVVNSLTILSNQVEDKITSIKLNEVTQLAQNILSSKQIKDEHLSAMLKYYELIDQLKNG